MSRSQFPIKSGKGRVRKRMIALLLFMISVVIVLAAFYIMNNLFYFQWDMNKVKKAGFVEKDVTLGDTVLHYAEGPANGPALLLIHGQSTNWESYAKVLPELSKAYHVYAVDCHGHGKSSKDPEKYNVEAMGQDFTRFMTEVIKEPVIISGHSSGGLITTWLAAHSPENIAGVVLEDPPFFSSEKGRCQKTFNYVDLSLNCHTFLEQSEEDDFLSYYIKTCQWIKYFKGGQKGITDYIVSYRDKNPNEPVKVFFLPPAITEPLRVMDLYDPQFGNTFYDSSWHKNFNHAEALSEIDCPSVLIHTSWSYDDQGILLAAMDEKDANLAHSLIKNNTLITVKSGHGFHFEKPQEFIKIMLDFKSSSQK